MQLDIYGTQNQIFYIQESLALCEVAMSGDFTAAGGHPILSEPEPNLPLVRQEQK